MTAFPKVIFCLFFSFNGYRVYCFFYIYSYTAYSDCRFCALLERGLGREGGIRFLVVGWTFNRLDYYDRFGLILCNLYVCLSDKFDHRLLSCTEICYFNPSDFFCHSICSFYTSRRPAS